MLSQDELKEVLHYDHRSGVFHWVSNGGLAGSLTTDGYISICIRGIRYQAHRLAWLYIYGEFPNGPLDHDNRIKSDNSISNLTRTTPRMNSKNRKKPVHNTSGVVGVYFDKKTNKWLAAIGVNRKLISLGKFVDKEEAIAVRRAAELLYGFHEKHGE
jgi:hypothetical protein